MATGCVTAPTAEESGVTNAERPRDGDLSDNGVPEGRGIGRKYTLDPDTSTLYVVVRNDATTFLSGFGRDHAVVAQGWEGTTTWSDDDLGGCRVHIAIPVTSLVVDPEGFREKAELPGDTNDQVRASAQEVLVGVEVLDAAQWGIIAFDATTCALADDGRVDVSGDFSFHGQTHTITVPMTVTTTGSEIRATGAVEFNTSDWGMAPYSALGGSIKHRDRLELRVDLRGHR